MMTIRPLSNLSDDDLLAALRNVVGQDHRVTAELLAHIGEVDARRLYRREAYSHMFAYCVRELKLSEPAAAKRLHVARAARRFPVLLELVGEGKIHLSGLHVLVPHLSDENHRDLLARSVHKSKRQIEELVAELAPKPDVQAQLRKLPAFAPTAATVELSTPPSQASLPRLSAIPAVASASPATDGGHRPAALAPSRSVILALAPERFKVQFTASRVLHDTIRRAQELLRHSIPNGDLAEIFERALTLLVETERKRKFGLTASPRRSAAEPSPGSRHIPSATKREVYERDDGQCTYEDATGRRCLERGFLEYDHIEPHGRGGLATASNTRLLCRPHNQLAAEAIFGRARMDAHRTEQGSLG